MMPRGAPEQLELELNRRKSRPPTKRASASVDAERLLELPDALLTRSHLRALGLERRAVDALFRALPVVALPGYARPLIRARDYVELVAANTYRGDRVRPMASTAGAGRIG
jgi:hypothetical protein